jgi:hypothetical protein
MGLQVEYQQGLIDTAVEEVLRLRSELSRRRYG